MISRSVINVKSIDDLIEKLEELISFYEEKFDFKNIRNTKIGDWLKKINNSEISEPDKFKQYFNINSYVRVLETFKEHPEKIKKESIKKILSGGSDDLTDESVNYFFELDTARRFILRDDFKSIDMRNKTDIIFESSIIPNRIFIECKNIRKEGSFGNNIRKANNQLDKVLNLNSEHKNLGIICLNLSEIIDKEKYLNLLEPITNEFISSSYYKQYDVDEDLILRDKNFEKVMLHLLQGMVELKFRELFLPFENNDYKFNELIGGIFYQAEVLVPFNNEGKFFVSRIATYYPFSNKECSKFLFHPLASGV